MRREVVMRYGREAVLIAVLLAGPVAAEGGPDDIDVYFREGGLLEMTQQPLEVYPDTEAGESERVDTAFPGAPPVIPHTVEDMLPITYDDNECLECHHPDNAEEDDVPLSKVHFEQPVMAAGKKGEPQVWVVRGYEEGDDVYGARFDCTMCHAPQATNVKDLGSRFVREQLPE
jgi:cytochrome c-type protein NapB